MKTDIIIINIIITTVGWTLLNSFIPYRIYRISSFYKEKKDSK